MPVDAYGNYECLNMPVYAWDDYEWLGMAANMTTLILTELTS